ncbi:carboxymuconolactone decarboxylase family protein [Ferrimonas balearica]|uniref:carboxymuconolactone decarboxylase family protein n=1 Tax=Ferrimonas balearica TaxID=44012 RepID=UPI001C99A307|nr:carboxymuconolactone decarboxylase family protein [Ferrimonas balearica]MBY5920765.1 carboxymuconolactone decarboxylase family protein [Ferrimonas balearica]MBY5996550.1 carboxymuconolactone decarboxylase family protein [Ferrimonas balearica]
MTEFILYDQDNAPQASRRLLESSKKAFGMIPNLHAVMAESPQLLAAYQQAHQQFLESSLDATEKTVVWQTINRFHQCHYCLPAHTAIAHGMGVDKAVIEALREGGPLPNPKLQILHDTTLALVRDRGQLSEAQQAAFMTAGYDRRNLLEIVLAIGQKVMSNFTNHLAHTPVDDPFKPFV